MIIEALNTMAFPEQFGNRNVRMIGEKVIRLPSKAHSAYGLSNRPYVKANLLVMQNKVAKALLNEIVQEMNPAVKVIQGLHKQGYVNNFSIANGMFFCLQTRQFSDMRDIRVDEIYRFEDQSGAMGRYYIYAIHERWSGVRGLLTALEPLDLEGQ